VYEIPDSFSLSCERFSYQHQLSRLPGARTVRNRIALAIICHSGSVGTGALRMTIANTSITLAIKAGTIHADARFGCLRPRLARKHSWLFSRPWTLSAS
jgi:hypothetical protein